MSLLLLPSIKFRFDTKYKQNAQYPGNVYNIAQLLPNFKCVEENPTPTINDHDIVDCSYTIHASFNQGNDLLRSNAGKLCSFVIEYWECYSFLLC